MTFVHRYLPRLLFWLCVCVLVVIFVGACAPASPTPSEPVGTKISMTPAAVALPRSASTTGAASRVDMSEVQRLLSLETTLATGSVALGELGRGSAAADALRATWLSTYQSLKVQDDQLLAQANTARALAVTAALNAYLDALSAPPVSGGLATLFFGSSETPRSVYLATAASLAAQSAQSASTLAARVNQATAQLGAGIANAAAPQESPHLLGVKSPGGPTSTGNLLDILGSSVLSAPELAGWYNSIGYYDATGVPIGQIAEMYIQEGAAEDVRGDVAFAQAVLETGGFSANGGGNNFAGIGACDGCGAGYSFPSVRYGVRAQIEMLKAYADASYTAAQAARPVAYPWINTMYDRGKAQTWIGLGGTWSSDPLYGSHVLGIYLSILTWALQHPA